jgi:hypothetical protein
LSQKKTGFRKRKTRPRKTKDRAAKIALADYVGRSGYPEIDEFFAAKKKYDPIGLFSNRFYEKYGS